MVAMNIPCYRHEQAQFDGHRALSPLHAGNLRSIVLAALALSLAPTESWANECDNPDSAWIFCSGFEEGSFATWDDYDGNPAETNRIVSDPGSHSREGNRVAQLVVPPGAGGADLVKVLPGNHVRLYARWYIQFEPGFSFSTQSHVGGGLHAGARSYLGRSDYRPAGNDWFSGWFETNSNGRPFVYTYYRGMYMDCTDPNGSCWGDHFPCMIDQGQGYCTKPEHRPAILPTPLSVGNWHCVELMMDGGQPSSSESGADGQMNLWVDGDEIGPWTNLWFRTSPNVNLSLLWLNVFFHGSHGSAGVRYDDVVVSTERIGCATELSPPRPPHNVTVE